MLGFTLMLALAFQPAPAAPVAHPREELHCAQDALGAEDRETLGRAFWEPDSNADEATRILRAAVDSCTERHGWGSPERQNAGRFALATNGLQVARTWLAARGVPIERWEAVYVATPVEERLAENSPVMRDRLLAEVRSFPATARDPAFEGRVAIFHVMRRGLELSQRDWGGRPTGF